MSVRQEVSSFGASGNDPIAERSQETVAGTHHFAIFAVFLALGLLAHEIYYRDAFVSLADVALTASALFLLLNPYSVWRVLAVCGFHVLEIVYHMPNVVNHWVFAGFQSLAFVVIALTVLIRNRRLETQAVFPSFIWVARFNLIFLYYFSGFHKLNSDYFSMDVSCGAVTYRQLVQRLSFLPTSDMALLVAACLGVIMELVLPTLLLMRRWQRLGAVLGILFHLILGIMGFWRFSMLAYASLLLFLPELGGMVTRLTPMLRSTASLQTIGPALQKWKWLPLALILPLGIVLLKATGYVRILAHHVGNATVKVFLFFFFVESAILVVVSLSVLISHRVAKAAPIRFQPPMRCGLMVTFLLVLSGFSPYLGLKTLNAFAMYSNLRTEGGYTNHFVVPTDLQIFSYQRDLVDLIETNINPLQRFVRSDMLLPYQQVRVEITKEINRGQKGIHVVFLHHGELISTTHAEDHPELGEPLNAVSLRLLGFRGIEKSGRRGCSN